VALPCAGAWVGKPQLAALCQGLYKMCFPTLGPDHHPPTWPHHATPCSSWVEPASSWVQAAVHCAGTTHDALALQGDGPANM
jgi:hypothetical protein